MRCLILIALSLVLASASQQRFNTQRFGRLLRSYGGYGNQMNDEFETEYNPRRHLGGLHDIIGRGSYFPAPELEEMCGHQNLRECIREKLENEPYGLQSEDDEEDQYTTGRRHGRQFEEDEDEYEPYGRSNKRKPGHYRQWQDLLNGDEEEYSTSGDEYENEFEQTRYGSPFQTQMRGGQCSPNPRQLPKLESINIQLATTLYKQARRQHDDKNTVVSPVAVLLGLGALSVGAKGHTKKEISVVGGQTPTVDGLSALIRLLKKGGQSMRGLRGLRGIQGIEDIEGMEGIQGLQGWMGENEMDEEYGQQTVGRHSTQIKPITGIFLSKTTPAQQRFIQVVQECLDVKVKKCDFQRHPQQCRQQINKWVSTKTQHKMRQLVPQDGITDNTKMVVVTGLQLKAKWGQQFRHHQTKRGVFYPLDSQKVKPVPFMQKRGVFKYHEEDNLKVVGIPTEGKDLTMYVILPKCKKCLTKIEKEELVEAGNLKRLLDNCDQKKRQVNVQLPKFQIKHKMDAKPTLIKKGITNMFEPTMADFSGITGQPKVGQYENEFVNQRGQVHVNKFLHEATIKVTDSGITAAGPQNQYQESYEQEQEYPMHQGQQYGKQYEQFENEDEIEDDTYMGTGRDRFEQVLGMNTYGQGQFGKNKQFKADHPFVFVVRHNPTKQVLLMGRVIDAGQKPTTTSNVDMPMEEIYPGQTVF